jgi:hypothetical protein
MALSEGVSFACCLLFVVCFDGSTARKMHPVTVDASAPRRMTATAQANGA